MGNNVIKVEGVSKRYRLGLKELNSDTLLGKICSVVKSPYLNFKRLRQLSKFSEEDDSVFWALNDINFEVKEGEVLGIIGKNGAGKSTLLKILSGITDPTSGRIKIHGRASSLLEVGTGFHPELSGRENIYMNGTILGMSRKEIDSKLDEIIHFSGMEKFIDTPVKFYSSGMKVRLGFSVAAHLEPEILIIDEVLAVGDYEFQAKCLGKIEDISKNHGRTILFVSHNLSSIQNLCSKCLVLKHGSIAFEGNTKKSIENYLSINESKFDLNLETEGIKSEGSGTITLQKIKIFSDSDNLAISPFSGGPFYIELNVKFKTLLDFNFSKSKIDLRIDDSFNQRKIWMSSEINGSFNLINNKCRFFINRLPLTPGEYLITVFIHDGNEIASWYPNLIKFRVEDAIYFQNNLKIPENQTNFITPYEFK